MDYARMRLKAAGDAAELDRILQLECRQRAAAKLSVTLECADFRFPTMLAAEQCTSEALAGFHAELAPEAGTVLDMTCGLGIDAFHMARKGLSVTAVELNPLLAGCARDNARALGLDGVEVVNADSVEWLSKDCGRRFDAIFIDPARRSATGGRLFALADCVPDVTANLELLKSRCNRLIVKASPMLDIEQTRRELGCDVDLYVVGTPTECKELVAVWPGRGATICVTVMADGVVSRIDLTAADDEVSTYAEVRPSGWIHEPWPAVMKARPNGLLCRRYGVSQLDRMTNLFWSEDVAAGFPGSSRRLVAAIPFSKQGLREFKLLGLKQADVAVRNFVMSAQELRKRIGVADGGIVRVMGAVWSGQRVLLVQEK